MEKTLRKFESEFTFQMIGGTFVYNVCDLIDYLELNDVEYFESGKIIKEFALRYNLSIYSAPRNIFSLYDAVELVKEEKTAGVIVEDLS